MNKESNYRIEALPNGLYLLYDYRCQWNVCFKADGSYAHGGAGSGARSMPQMLNAVRSFINSQKIEKE